ncbi:MAG: hypothetical protein AAF585_25015 [Verrucomicrobiota bacterium]
MAILRSMDGKFYNVPDDQLESHLVPADEVKAKLDDARTAKSSEAQDEVTPHGYCWRNCWRRNCWRNYCPW